MEISIQPSEITKVSIPYSVDDGKWQYQDILEFDSGSVPSQAELETIIAEKFNAWKAHVETPIN